MMKRVLAIMFAAMLVLSMCVVASADGETGKITIKGAIEGYTYSIYKLANLESFVEGGAYSYTVTDSGEDIGWDDFFASREEFAINEDGYLVLAEGKEISDPAQFAKDALAWAKANGVAADASATAGTDPVAFENLGLGYYLVDSSVGVLCSLDTLDNDVEIDEKNLVPTVVKQVEEDSTGAYGATNDADFFQTVNFKATITVQPGTQGLKFYDAMSAGLTFDDASVEVYAGTIADENLLTAGTEYTFAGAGVDDKGTAEDDSDDYAYTFALTFDQAYCDGLARGTEIIIVYAANVNENAVVAGNGNPNEALIIYGDNNWSEPSQTITYTFSFDLVKTDIENKLITGAEFKLYSDSNAQNEIALVKNADGTYRRANDGETAVDIVVADLAAITIVGLDSDTYYLKETVAPEGYNLLKGVTAVTIDAENNSATVEQGAYVEGGVQVINKSGSELPETGGTGTTIFVVVGSILVLVTGVLLVAKKRMSKIAG